MTSIFSDSWIDIVFDGRNQQYGAYELRKITEKNILIAFLISFTFISVGVNIILLKHNPSEVITSVIGDLKDPFKLTEVNLLPIVNPVINPPQQEEQVQKTVLKSTLKFNNLQIVRDESTTTDTVHAQQDFQSAEAGTVDQTVDPTLTVSVDPIQLTGNVAGGIQSDEPKTWVEQMPEFPGGERAFFEYLHNNIKYPQIAIENGMEGTAYVQFVVDKDGSLTNITIGKGTYKCLNDEALRVVQSMPRWKPGKQNGEPVRVRYSVPIKFALD